MRSTNENGNVTASESQSRACRTETIVLCSTKEVALVWPSRAFCILIGNQDRWNPGDEARNRLDEQRQKQPSVVVNMPLFLTLHDQQPANSALQTSLFLV